MRKKRIKLRSKVKINFIKDRPGHDFRYALNSDKINNKFNNKNVKLIFVNLNNNNFDLKIILKKIYSLGYANLLVESGPNLLKSFQIKSGSEVHSVLSLRFETSSAWKRFP